MLLGVPGNVTRDGRLYFTGWAAIVINITSVNLKIYLNFKQSNPLRPGPKPFYRPYIAHNLFLFLIFRYFLSSI